MNNSGEVREISKFRYKIAYIVPTRNRPKILAKLLDSINEQTVQPDQVIIVDGSDESIEPEIKCYLNSKISYVRVFPPGLTKQRNEGRKVLKEDITLAGYLDDDIVMEKNATEEMLRFWETAEEDLGGASFYITNSYSGKANSNGKTSLVYRLFFLNNGAKGQILKSGNSTGVSPLSENIYTQWLSGGTTVWKKNIFKEFSYDEWFRGYAYFEDVDFSYNVSKKYKLSVIHSAKVQHFPPPLKPQKVRDYIKTHVIQQYYFVKKYPDLSVSQFYWSIIGNILISTFNGIRKLRADSFSEVAGSFCGLYEVISGKIKQTDESFRE